ncbi:MAG TPA: C40 family peptidase [Propionibacteriaceae bacterium]|nr:C40 family peptidase [Propionibacteriaceae bacterium]
MTSGRGDGRQLSTGIRALLRTVLTSAVSGALAVSVMAGPTVSPAAADPPLTVEEAKAQVLQLETEAEAVDQQALDVKIKLAAGSKALALKHKDLRAQTAKVTKIRSQVRQVALAQFQNRSLDTTAKLFLTSDTDGFLNKIATVEKVSENQNRVLQDFQSEQAHLSDLERSAKVDVAALRVSDQELTRLRASSAAKIVKSKAILARLTAEERARIAAEERAAELAAQRAAELAARRAAEAAAAQATSRPNTPPFSSRSSNRRDESDSDSTDGSRTRPTDKGAIALAYAKRQLGKPYVWAAEGPNAFDCSGLTSAAWRAAGVSIPRTSAVQARGAGRPVARADLQPGDLVFFYDPVSHVAMYVGDNVIIHAPRPGRSVTYGTMSNRPYAGARRPG